MEKQELYHFHKAGCYDHFWKVGNTINVSNDFKSSTYKRFCDFTTASSTFTKDKANLQDVINYYFESGEINGKIAMKIIEEAYRVSFRANEFKRESALENFRVNNNHMYPSRLHSMYLTDEKGILEWSKKFGRSNLELYRVEIEGDIFKTSEFFIPDETLPYDKFYEKSYYYWNPNFKKAPEDSNEYLAQGKVLIKEKINISH